MNILFLLSLSSLTAAIAVPDAAPLPTPAPQGPVLQRAACNQDNCLRALTNKGSIATSFCLTYTSSSDLPIPTYATSGCANLPSRVSSACSCIVTPTPRSLHRVYGGTNGIDGTEYTIYEQSVNIRSDSYILGTEAEYNQYYNNCLDMCRYYGDGCQTLSFAIIASPQPFYLCYLYETLFQPDKLTGSPGSRRNVVEQRYQS